MAELDGFELVPPIRRNSIAKLDKDGRVYLPLFVKLSLGISDFEHEAYQVLFNKKTWVALCRFIPKASANDDSYPTHWVAQNRNGKKTGGKTLRLNLSPLLCIYRLAISAGEVELKWDEKKMELTIDLSTLKKVGATREVKALPA